MKKRIIIIIGSVVLALLLVGGIIFGLTQCSKKEPEPGKTSVWSAYNTVKVIQQTSRNDTYTKLDPKLNAQMMRNEYEGAQLIVTAAQDTTYTLTAGTLKNEKGEVFPAENVQIYHQKYQTIKINYNGDKAFQAGDSIPDMLLPLDIAVKYGENKILANNNQGITVEFNSANVPAGVYTGNFTLDLNGEKTSIPVSVEVWDIEFEGKSPFQSCFMIYRDELIIGEYSNTDEVVNAYIDKLLEYKTNPYVVRTYYTPENFVAEVQRLFDNKNYNSVVIPYDFQLDYRVYEAGEVTPAAQNAVNYIKALVKASTPGKNYIQYAYFYPSTYDEADVVEGKAAPSEVFLKEGGEYQQTLQLAVQQLKEEGWFDAQTPEFAAQTEAAILEIPAVFTNVNFVNDWVGDLNAAFCPYISLFNDTAVLNQYQDAAMDNSFGDLWAYTCSGPINPYPTFHIDDGTLDMRVCGWMEKAYGVTGYLYYKVNAYALIQDNVTDDHINLYENPARYYEVNGDGFLLYPGKYYGSSAPFATVRLTAYRDGMDDYEMLCVYENLLREYAEKNNLTNFDFNLYVEDLYRSLFNGVVAKQDDSLVYAARAELAKRILSLKNDGKLSYDPATVQRVTVSTFDGGQDSVVIKSEYKDKDEEIGSKTKMFRPYYGVKVNGLSGAQTLEFTYTNTGDMDLVMQITLITDSMDKVTVDTSYCGVGRTRQVKVNLNRDLEIDLSKVTEIRLTFDNVETNDEGMVVLLPDRTFTVSDFSITKD